MTPTVFIPIKLKSKEVDDVDNCKHLVDKIDKDTQTEKDKIDKDMQTEKNDEDRLIDDIVIE